MKEKELKEKEKALNKSIILLKEMMEQRDKLSKKIDEMMIQVAEDNLRLYMEKQE
jgi:hypothetical protein